MYPFAPWSRDQSSIRSSLSEASASTQHVHFSFSYSSAYSPVSSMPPPPPPSPMDGLLDINPRKCSFSGNSLNNSCAFPSWPKRPSLIGADSEGSGASAYLSDEDLFPEGPVTPEPVDEESAAIDPRMGAASLTTEQQIQLLRAAAEEEAQRARFLAQVQAHAKAQQALRVAQLVATEKETSKRKKRKPVVAEKKRRTASSSKSIVYRA